MPTPIHFEYEIYPLHEPIANCRIVENALQHNLQRHLKSQNSTSVMRMDENDGDQVVTGQGSMEELDYEASDNNVEEESMEQPSENDSEQQSENNNVDLEYGVTYDKAETVVNGETKSEVAQSMEGQAGISVRVPDHSKDIQEVKADSRDKISRKESGSSTHHLMI